jgi:transcription elongation factor Elf1
MDNFTATEQAYKNGYEQGMKDAVKHGSWIEDGYYGNPFVCSYCGHEGCYSGGYGSKEYYYTNYCPNCGADMRGEQT